MFKTRLLSGIVLVLIALFVFRAGGYWLAAILFLISLIGFKELTGALDVAGSGEAAAQENKVACDFKKWNGLEIAGALGITAYYAILTFAKNDTLQWLCIVAVFMAVMLIYVVRFPKYHASQVTGAFFSFIYAPFMLSYIYLTRMNPQGVYMVWLILISSWGCDTCAYVVGMLIGKKKIFPVLSPKKSLEGCIGGIVGAALLGGLYGHFFVEAAFPDQTIKWLLAFICAVGAAASQVGDLAASAIKRNHKIKDYGTLIPGHGGIMDRFDSVIVTAPMIYFLSSLLLHF